MTSMKNILVTGGAGFIGSNFIRFILQANKDIHVINLDALTYAGSLSNLTDLPHMDQYEFVKGNITNANLVNEIFDEWKIDTVVHFAAESHVDRSIVSPSAFVETNINGTFVLLQAALRAWKGSGKESSGNFYRFHHISTDEVYGTLNPDDAAFNENSRYNPRSPYSASKASSDHLVRSYYYTYQLPITVTNCSNNYGPFQHPEKFIPLMIISGLQGKPLPIYGDGLQVRDWIHVWDHCDAIYKILLNGSIGATYNIGGGVQYMNIQIVERICDILDSVIPQSKYRPHNQLVMHIPDRPGHDRRYAMDISFVYNQLDWKPTTPLPDGILRTVQWYLDHPAWVDEMTRDVEFSDWVNTNYELRKGGSS